MRDVTATLWCLRIKVHKAHLVWNREREREKKKERETERETERERERERDTDRETGRFRDTNTTSDKNRDGQYHATGAAQNLPLLDPHARPTRPP